MGIFSHSPNYMKQNDAKQRIGFGSELTVVKAVSICFKTQGDGVTLVTGSAMNHNIFIFFYTNTLLIPMNRQVSYLLFVSHGALPSHHDLAASFCLQLLGRETSWPQNPADEIILQREAKNILVLIFLENRILHCEQCETLD